MKRTIFVTGTDTGAGKTVLTALLAGFLRERGIRVAALKPVCSGGRDDARALYQALGGLLSLNQINPWYFRAPIAPVLAARRQKRTVRLQQVLRHISAIQKDFDVVLIEGAGGLLSPLGEDFDSRDLIAALHAMPVVVAQNRLGVVNHVLLTLEALPAGLRAQARVVLMASSRPGLAGKSNPKLLAQYPVRNIDQLPWLGMNFSLRAALQKQRVRPILEKICLGQGIGFAGLSD